jgi:hypothetical protein
VASAKDYQKQVCDVLQAKIRKGEIKLKFRWESVPEAKATLAEIRQKQKRLRLIKKDVNAELRAIRARYSQKAGGVSPGVISSLVLGKGTAKSLAASKRRNIRADRDRELQPYEEVKRIIDNALVELDEAKYRISAWLDQNR